MLPQTMRNVPIFWSDEELAWLQGSYLLAQVRERRMAIEEDYRKICDIAPDFKRFSLLRFSWARMIVCSRNFGIVVNGKRTSAMVGSAVPCR